MAARAAGGDHGADDLLFVGITVFGATVAVRLRSPVERVLGGLAAVLFVVRFVLEATGSEAELVRQPRPDPVRGTGRHARVLSVRGLLEARGSTAGARASA